MHYMLLIYQEEAAHAQWSQEQLAAEYQGYNTYTEEVAKSGALLSGDALMPSNTATTVRLRHGKILTTDGPFAETKEQLGGFYLLNCKDLDEAIAWVTKIPTVANGSIEIRPVAVFS